MIPAPFPETAVPELKTMLICAKLKLTEQEIRTARTLMTPLFDWKRFISLVKMHKLAPAVFDNLKKHLKTDVPVNVYQKIETMRNNNVRNGLANISVGITLSTLFHANAIDHLFMKGFCLSQTLYGHPCLRHSGDIDVVIREKDFIKAINLLESNGYRQVQSDIPLTDQNRDKFLAATHHLSYSCPKTKTKIEIHFRFSISSDYLPFDFDEAWNTRQMVRINGYEFPFPCARHTLIYLVFHGCSHFWSSFLWLKDITDVFNTWSSFNEQSLYNDMKSFNQSRPCVETLYLIHTFFGNPMPDDAKRFMEKDSFLKLVPRMMGYILKNPKKPLSILIFYFHSAFFLKEIRFNLFKIKMILTSKLQKRVYNPGNKSILLSAIMKS